MKVLKTVYTGYVRPILEYGSSAWNTVTAKSNQQKVEKFQNQSLRIITGGSKSTPILKMETITGLQALVSRGKKRDKNSDTAPKVQGNAELRFKQKAKRQQQGKTEEGQLLWNYTRIVERSFACGMRCTYYKAETEATKEALNMVNNKISKTSKVVILSDARSVLQTLENTKDTGLDTVRKKTPNTLS
ncbi:hypothetical protein ElyMa_000559700 [Elysia marginata]|uniref:RNase H type-1 domain-containing protein n=1 Tax=Elysia marginata TaxID=1093978 RepID=A0AAV4G1J4_9GAST|nr:hypothetical protein ElyMa_000559700 [Elysia marginata]